MTVRGKGRLWGLGQVTKCVIRRYSQDGSKLTGKEQGPDQLPGDSGMKEAKGERTEKSTNLPRSTVSMTILTIIVFTALLHLPLLQLWQK